MKSLQWFRNDHLLGREAIFSKSCHLVYKMKGINVSLLNTNADFEWLGHCPTTNLWKYFWVALKSLKKKKVLDG